MTRYTVTVLSALALLASTSFFSYQRGTSTANMQCDLAAAQARAQAYVQAAQVADKREVVDNTNYRKLRELENENATLRASLAGSTVRMHVTATSCQSSRPDTSGVDDGSYRAELHPKTATDLAALTGDADATAIKLNSLQEWVRARR